VNCKRLVIAAALSLLAACGSDSVTGAINGAVSGTLSFNYTGGGGGSFSANGGITSAAFANSAYTTTWAAGFKEASDNSTNIVANIARTSTTSDFAAITVKGQSTGTFNIDVNCVATSTSTCNDVALFTAYNSSAQTFGNVCSFTSGSITIATLSSTSAVGTFSGSGGCVTPSGTVTPWAVTNGSFNVPLLASVPANLP
jgi:hypothetical protein